MTISMLFRGVGPTTVAPAFIDPIPLINSANNSLSKQALVVFWASAIFTSCFVAVTVISRSLDAKSPFMIGIPSSIALYFANLMTYITSGGFNNPIVALIIAL